MLLAHRQDVPAGFSSSRTSNFMAQGTNNSTPLKSDLGDTSIKNSPLQAKSTIPATQVASQAEDTKSAVQASEPLAPPPRPAPANAADTPDYFSSLHNGGTHFSNELNPFEQSFGQPSSETPGKGLQLPPVAALTSPAIPGPLSRGDYNWPNQLRSGPLSPAMLPGPTGGGDYFDSIGRGFPTPNESSLRTGLTPGGGGSMFPVSAPSPNSQAIFQQLQSGGATPGTLDFHRTAMNAAARSKNNQFAQTSNPQEMAPNNTMDQKLDPFAQHDANDAANGLFMLAKGGQGTNQFAMPNQPQQPIQSKPDNKRGARNNNGSLSGPDAGESPDSQEENSRPNTRGGRGKKTVKAETASSNRRKSEAASKGGNKRAKGNSGSANVDPALDPHDDDDDDMSDDDEGPTHDANGKKMTDEEKRRNFLERNRVAALKCRQRKKQWLANLQAKVEMYSAENDALNTQVAGLHDEIRNLRALLMGHKDCPVGHAQGIGQYLNGIQDPSGFANQHVNPYGMAMPNGAGMQAGMQRS